MSIDSWKIIDDNYLNYLRRIEGRIPLTNYGSDKMKPFFGSLFEVDNLIYVTQVSSPKPRHATMKNSIDFHKYYFKNRLVGVVNLNYMFPVPKPYINDLIYSQIDKYKTFPSEKAKYDYIRFLKLQLAEIQQLTIERDALKLYNMKYDKPNSPLSKRCFDFKQLEEYAKQFKSIV